MFPLSGQTLWELHHNLHFWFICQTYTTKGTNTHSFLVAAHQFSSLLSNPLYLMIILWPYSTGLSLGLKTSPTVVHIAHFLYSCARYAFMFNTTAIIKAADLSCSSGLHRTLYTVLCRSSDLKTARTLRDFFIGLRGGECYEFKQSI